MPATLQNQALAFSRRLFHSVGEPPDTKIEKKIGAEEENFALLEEITTELLCLLDDKQITFRFSFWLVSLLLPSPNLY